MKTKKITSEVSNWDLFITFNKGKTRTKMKNISFLRNKSIQINTIKININRDVLFKNSHKFPIIISNRNICSFAVKSFTIVSNALLCPGTSLRCTGKLQPKFITFFLGQIWQNNIKVIYSNLHAKYQLNNFIFKAFTTL